MRFRKQECPARERGLDLLKLFDISDVSSVLSFTANFLRHYAGHITRVGEVVDTEKGRGVLLSDLIDVAIPSVMSWPGIQGKVFSVNQRTYRDNLYR